MILEGWAVDGFGPLRDFRVDGLGPGLIVVSGPNEAGKSSLLAFLRFVLFGFVGREPRREPVHGGRHGGRVRLVERPGGPGWTVERYADRRSLTVSDEAGRPADEDTLRRLLGGADGRVFRNIFAFGLSELSVIDSLTDEAVRDHVFSAGITGAGADVRRALRALQAQAEVLWRPRGASRISELVAQLEGANRDLAAARAAAAGYPDLVAEEQRQADRVQALAAHLEEMRGRQRRLERLILLWPVWQRCQQAEVRLGEMPEPGPFPENGLRRMEELLERRRAVRLQEERLKAELRQREDGPRLLDEAGPALEAVWADAGAQTQRLQGLSGVQAEVVRHGQRLRAALADLGPGWTQERLAAGIGAVALTDALDAWAVRLRHASDAVRAAQGEVARADVGVEGAQAQVARFPVDLPTPDAWRRQRQGLAAAQARHRTAEAWTAGAAVLGALAVVLAVVGQRALAAVVCAGAVAAALLGRGVWRAGRAQRELVEWEGLGPAVEARSAALGALEQARAQAAHRREDAQRLAAAEDDLAVRWRAWKAEHALPEALSPEGARAFLQALARSREIADDLAHAEEVLRERQKAVAAWETRAQQAIDAAEGQGRPPTGGLDLVSRIGDLWRRWTAQQHEAQTVQGLRARLGEVELEARDLEGRWSAMMQAAGVDPAGPDAEEAFRHRAEAVRVWREAAEAARLRRAELAAALGEGAGADELRGQLSAGADGDAWPAELEAERARVAEAEDDRDAAAGALREAALARRALEEQADVARISAEVEGLRSDLAVAVRAWRVNAVAQALLRHTLAEFMAARQPDVLRVASSAFAAITGNRYRAVVQAESGESLHVVDAAGRPVAPESLSRGAAEQLYLAVRLGLADSFAEKSVPLPLVMDDVLVNFDPVRAAAATSALVAFGQAQGRQVLLFTCHPETVACVRAVEPTCRVVEMPSAAVWAGAQEAAAAVEPGPAESGRRRRGRPRIG